jgi:hypothetical protein
MIAAYSENIKAALNTPCGKKLNDTFHVTAGHIYSI